MRRLALLPVMGLALLTLAGCSFLTGLVAAEPLPEDYVAREDGFRYAKSCLPPGEQALYDQLLEGLKAQEETIPGLYPDVDLIGRVVEAIHRDYPELFWFSGEGVIETTFLGETPLSADYLPRYLMDETQRSAAQAQVDAWTAECLAGLSPEASNYEKALYVYEYLIAHADYWEVEDNSILNIMLSGGGLCGCYAKTAQYLLAALEVPCAYISGQAEGEHHAWNLLWLDGNPCWMDPTWGDPVYEGGNANDGPSYEYFAMTTSQLLRTHTPDDAVPVPDCTTEDYNYFRKNGLYLESYDPRAVTAALERALTEGWTKVPLQFAPEAYDEAVSLLFDQGQIYDLLDEASGSAGLTLGREQTLWYSENAPMYTVSLFLPV